MCVCVGEPFVYIWYCNFFAWEMKALTYSFYVVFSGSGLSHHVVWISGGYISNIVYDD